MSAAGDAEKKTLRSSLSDVGQSIRRRMSGGPPPDAALLAESASATTSPGAARHKPTLQHTDSSTLASSEFNDDPQWRMVFLDNHEHLCKQAEQHGNKADAVRSSSLRATLACTRPPAARPRARQAAARARHTLATRTRSQLATSILWRCCCCWRASSSCALIAPRRTLTRARTAVGLWIRRV